MRELAIIIPTKNEENTIPYLVNSIKEQTFKDWTIILADSPKSIDRTKEVAKDYGCFIVKGGTLSEGRNRGMDEAVKKGFNLCMLIDADAVLPSRNFLEQAVDEFYGRKLDLAGTTQKPFNYKTKIDLGNVIETCERSRDWKCNSLYEIVNLSLKKLQTSKKHPCMQQCMIVKSELYEIFGGFDEKMNFGEDSDYSERAIKAGYKFGILEDCGKVFTSTRRFEGKFWKVVFNQAKFNWERFHGKKHLNGEIDYYNL